MVFSSILFLFYFLPIVLGGYFILPRKARNFWLLISSLFFYGWGEPRFIWIMVFSTVLDYSCGLGIHTSFEKNRDHAAKAWLLVSIIGNLGMLFFFKYSNFFIDNVNLVFGTQIPLLKILLPIGISFYTFQTMSYSIDVYRKEASVQTNILNFATYVTLFPQLIAGPIVRYQTIAKSLNDRTESIDEIAVGIHRFISGLAKKVLLANTIGIVWQTVQSPQFNQSILGAWLGLVAFGFQIYFDFSGYSDMAIGLGKIFGFTFLENFNYPYMSQSITDFWRRWHISLGTWFKEYVYIPLGGNRNGLWMQIRNILIVWFLTGFWHGASWNFILWGLLFALLLIFEKFWFLEKLKTMPRWIGHLYTLFFVLFSWSLFAFDSLSQSLAYMSQLFAFGRLPFFNGDVLYLLRSNALLLLILCCASTPYPTRFIKKFATQNERLGWLLINGMNALIFMVTVSYLVSSSYNPFLYFKF